MQVQAHHLDEEELPRGAICCWNPDNQSGCCGCDKSVEPSYLPRWCCAECVYPNYVGCNTFAIVLVVFTLIPFGALIPRIYVACIWKVPLWGIHYHRKMIAVVGPPMMVQQQPGMVMQQQPGMVMQQQPGMVMQQQPEMVMQQEQQQPYYGATTQ